MSRRKFYWEKDEDEIKTYAIDFTNYADVGETIDDSDISVFDSASLLISGMVEDSSFSGLILSIVFSGGAEGETYIIRAEVDGTGGMHYVAEGELKIW